MEDIVLDLWGGSQNYSLENKTYSVKRLYGLYSNLTVSLYGIAKLSFMGYEVKELSLILEEYDINKNFYTSLFKNQNSTLNFENISQEEKDFFLRYCEPNKLGLGRERKDLNFNILSKIYQKFYQPSEDCVLKKQKIIKEKNLNLNETVFVWARKTDKVYETSIPTIDTYLKLLKTFDLSGKKIVIQTDDYSVLEEFKKTDLDFTTLDVLPYSYTNDSFHSNLNSVTDENFYKKYKQTKEEYLQYLSALVLIMSECKFSVSYPGNLTTVVPLIKGSFDGHFGFINDNTLI
jgi:hypothetical protein